VSLLGFLIRRTLQSIPLLFGLVTLVFFLSRLLPGDPTAIFLSPTVPPSLADQLRTQFGLDRPILEQYMLWIGALLRGELGISFTHNAPVVDVLLTVFPNTALLGLAALVLEIVIAVLVTAFAVQHAGSHVDKWISNGALIAYTLPTFWIGIILLSVFSFQLGIFPSSQMRSVGIGETGGVATIFDVFRHLALPALTVAVPGAAGLVRYLRTSVNKTLGQEYVLAAKSMGLSSRKVFRHYVLPNSMSAMVSLLGIEIGVLLTGVLVTETLFAWPGMGRIVVMAIFARDYPLILGCTIVAGIVVVLGNIVADAVNALIDPRIRIGS